jgi:type IV secretion system protein VirB4
MLNIQEFRKKVRALPDLLNIAFMVGQYDFVKGPYAIALQKDGSLLSGFRFAGPDLGSMSVNNINALSGTLNAALARLGSGWSAHITSIRYPANGYIPIEDCHFPDPISQLIDDERRGQYEQESAHYLSEYFCTIAWQTSPDAETGMADAIVTRPIRKKGQSKGMGFETIIGKYRQDFENILSMFSSRCKVVPLDERNLLTHIHECLTGERHPVNPPHIPAYLDVLIGRHDFVAGLEPQLDGRHIRVVTFTGYPQDGFPEILEGLSSLPFPLRYTTRFIFLDPVDALPLIDKYRKAWFGARHTLASQIGAQFTGEASTSTSEDTEAVRLAFDAQQAKADASSGFVRFGYFTATVVLRDADETVLLDRVKSVESYLNNLGFVAKRETTNAVEAFLGSISGHTWENVRRPLMHSANFADLSPKTSVWAGSERCPSPLMKQGGKRAPALFYAATSGSTPYRFNLHVGDVGHAMIVGPTGAGKSTLLALMAAQWRRYKGARFIGFDKGRSMYAPCCAVGGAHYDIAGELSDLTFAPLAGINKSQAERAFAEEWLEALCELQGMTIRPRERDVIHAAIEGLSQEEGRSLTDVRSLLQDEQIKAAIGFYTGMGRTGTLLDARTDTLGMDNRFTVFEMEHLLTGTEQAKLTTGPVLLYIFHRIEQMLDGSPTLITLDEGWLMLDNPQFLAKLAEWLVTLRKKNAAVVFATTSLSQLAKSPLLPILKESCPTKIFLPNDQATSEDVLPMYRDMGLNDRQVELLQMATPKSDYYVFSPDGHRLINLAMGPIALAFCGVSDPRDVKRIAELKESYGPQWPVAWLRERLPANRQDWVEYAKRGYGM